METLNIHKGYAKIGALESQHQPPYPHRRAILIAASSLLLLTFLLLSLTAALVHESTQPDQFDPIRFTCNVTQHPSACIASISAINNHPAPNPTLILSLLLRSTASDIKHHASLPNTLILNTSTDNRTAIALQDCGSLLIDALASVNASAAKVEAKAAEGGLTESELGDVRTWISAAMTDEETCVDGLVEVGAAEGVVAVMRKAVQGDTVGMSNSLAILANMGELKFGMIKMCHQMKH